MLVSPSKTRTEVEEESLIGKDLYRMSHNNYDVGEMVRNYDNNNDNNNNNNYYRLIGIIIGINLVKIQNLVFQLLMIIAERKLIWQ